MSDVEDFLHDVIATLDRIDSPKADRIMMLASDQIAKMGAAKEDTCLARAMGYSGPTGAVIVSGVAQGVLTRSHDAPKEYGRDVDLQTVIDWSAAARIIRTSAKVEHEGCLVFMMRLQTGGAPTNISHRPPKAAERSEGDA